MIEELIEANCIQIGNFRLKNGENSKYYFDMKNLISHPNLLKRIGDELYKKLPEFDIICGIPYGGLPIACYISTTYNKPLIFLRDKKKSYGMKKLIEGEYKKEDRCVVIDDVITTGNSIREVLNNLKEEINVVETAVIFNRQESNMKLKYLFCKNDVVKYRLKSIKEKKKSNLIISADIEDPQKLLDLVEKIGDYICVCKIHYDILDLDNYENNFIEEIIKLSNKFNFLIMEDRKFIDISFIVEKQYLKIKNWADLVTIHSSVSKEMVSKFCGGMLLARMSNSPYDFTIQANELAESNKDNIVGFITQKRIQKGDLVCMTPGVSLEKSKVEDQNYRDFKNIDTDFIIVGRAIYTSSDPLEKVKLFLES